MYKTRINSIKGDLTTAQNHLISNNGEAWPDGIKQILDASRSQSPELASYLAKPIYGGPASLSYKTWLYPHLGGAALGGAAGYVYGDDKKHALIGAALGAGAGVGLNSYWKRTLPAIKVDPEGMMRHVRKAIDPEFPALETAINGFHL